MTEHTPGPWTVEEYGDDDAPNLVIHRDTESRICFMATPGSHGDPARIKADARLIAAAPDMLAILRAIVSDAMNEKYTAESRLHGIYEMATDAIWKAEGSAAIKPTDGD